MAAQAVDLHDDHPDASNLGVAHESSNAHSSPERGQRPNKVQTNRNCLYDSETIIGIGLVPKIGLYFNPAANIGIWQPVPGWRRAQFEEVELLREKLHG